MAVIRLTYQRTSRRRWTFRQFRCLLSEGLSLLPLATTQIGERESQLTPREVTALQHELGDDTVERTSFVSKSILASRELAEVPGGFGDNIVVELEDDATSGLAVNGDIKLVTQDTDRKIGM